MRKISPLERCFYPLCELFAFDYAISPAIYVSHKLPLVLFTFYGSSSLIHIFEKREIRICLILRYDEITQQPKLTLPINL